MQARFFNTKKSNNNKFLFYCSELLYNVQQMTSMLENLQSSGFVTRKDSNQPAQLQRLAKGVARMLKRLCTSKGDYQIKQWFSSIASLFKI